MTYFSQFPINMTRREARSMLASPYKLHAAVAGSFPSAQQSDESSSRVLWRVDSQDNGSAVLYIVSPEKPSLVGLNEQIGFPDLEPQWKTREYDPFLERIQEGQRYAFRLVANPVVKTRRSPKGKPQRLAHLTVLQQAAWLAGKAVYEGTNAEIPERFASQAQSRAEKNGFLVCSNETQGVPSLVVSNSRKLSFKKGESHTITLATAQYDGVLEVIDTEALRKALVCGIGHAKGFGCGLLTLVPYRTSA